MPDEIDAFFDRYPDNTAAISRHLRVLVNDLLPDAHEILYAKDNHVGYSFTASSRDKVVYICPLEKYVRLGFMYGGYLPDPDHLLVGEGKRLRHIKVYTLDEAHNPAFKPLIQSSWDYALKNLKKKL